MNRSSRRTTKVLASITAALTLMVAPATASLVSCPTSEGSRPGGRWRRAAARRSATGRATRTTASSARRRRPTATIRPGSRASSNTRALSFGGDDFVTIPGTSLAREQQVLDLDVDARGRSLPGTRSATCWPRAATNCATASVGHRDRAATAGSSSTSGDGHEPGAVRRRPARADLGRQVAQRARATYDGPVPVLWLDGKDLGEPPGSPTPIEYDLPDTGDDDRRLRALRPALHGDLDQVMIFDKVLRSEIWSDGSALLNKPLASASAPVDPRRRPRARPVPARPSRPRAPARRASRRRPRR